MPEINEGNKSIRISLYTKNMTVMEIHKIQMAFEQFLLKAKDPLGKFKRRVKRILTEVENEQGGN